MKLEIGKVYRARNGRLWRVVHIHPSGVCPVVAVPESPNDAGDYAEPGSHALDGLFFAGGRVSEYDLIAEHREPMKLTLWLALLNDGDQLPCVHESAAKSAVETFGGTIHRGTWVEEVP